jgi:hypothetical protein
MRRTRPVPRTLAWGIALAHAVGCSASSGPGPRPSTPDPWSDALSLAPSHSSDPSGTTPNPIQAHSSGSMYSVAFPNAGLYPFYVSGQDTKGLLGVVQVK